MLVRKNCGLEGISNEYSNKISGRLCSKACLHDISLDIRDKEFVGIIGPNGGGKVHFKMLHVLQPNGGKIFLTATELSDLIIVIRP